MIPLLVLAFCSHGSSLAPEVALRADARTPGHRIRLVDVIAPEDRDRVPDDLLAIDLGRAPSFGFGRRLDRRAIEAAVPDGALALVGPSEVLVRSDTARLDPFDIDQVAERHLREVLFVPDDAIVEVARGAFELRCPRGRKGIDLTARLRGQPEARGSVVVDVEVSVDGRRHATVPVTFLIRTFDDLPVLARDLARGEALSPSDVELQRTETTRMASLPPADVTPLFGLLARRSLRAGQHLFERDFDRPVLVRRNQSVTIAYQSGALRVESFGIARGEGALGDIVRVENLKTRKIVFGRVAGPGLLEMNP